MFCRAAAFFSIALILSSTRQTEATEISFRHDVMAVLSKAGCNLGTCHGNARGKGGFQISLRGQDPEADYLVLTREMYGRRANISDPDQSLMLLKPTMQMAHEGGKRFSLDSAEYRILRDWIAAGMPNDPSDKPTLQSLSVTPDELFLNRDAKSSDRQRTDRWQFSIQAIARFSDGASRDVTSLSVFEISHPIADVAANGTVVGRTAGEATILVRYLNQQRPVRVAFVARPADFKWSAPQPANFIDDLVFEKLQKLAVNPSDVCDDATFIRRLFLDILGILPTADEARRFVADSNPEKRRILIDQVLDRPEFADWWALKWADLLRIEEKTLDQKGVENFHSWLRDCFATRKPLDQMVREIITGRGSTYEVPPANFYRALRTPFERSETVGQLFLGVRLQCSKCHNHPFDRWTQDDYYSWGSVFARIDYKILENRRRDTNDSHEFDGEQIVFLNTTGEAKDPRIGQPRPARFLGANNPSDSREDPLNELANWLTDVRNERFVQMLANRTWQQVMGRGIVDPIDDFRATNPASNPELLKALANQLAWGNPSLPVSIPEGRAEQAFDLRLFLKTILNSNTYQLSSDSNATNRDDETNFSRAIVRRNSAEQLLDAASQVLEVPLQFGGYPVGHKAVQIPGVGMNRPRDNRMNDADRFLRLFGKPPRLQSCDCERSDETTLGQTFQMVSGPLINRLLQNDENRLDRLLAANPTADSIVTELYWAALSRSPTNEERDAAIRYVEASKNRRAALEDLTWGLLNSNEFLLRR
jgi:hypothetical protein